jgi:hypothetical protein
LPSSASTHAGVHHSSRATAHCRLRSLPRGQSVTGPSARLGNKSLEPDGWSLRTTCTEPALRASDLRAGASTRLPTPLSPLSARDQIEPDTRDRQASRRSSPIRFRTGRARPAYACERDSCRTRPVRNAGEACSPGPQTDAYDLRRLLQPLRRPRIARHPDEWCSPVRAASLKASRSGWLGDGAGRVERVLRRVGGAVGELLEGSAQDP